MLYLRSQADLLADIQAKLRDSGQARWTATEIYHALNRALDDWHGRVSVADSYELPNGWPNDQFEVTLEDWLPDDVQPQAQWPVDPLLPNESTISTWKDISSYAVEPAGDGTRTLRLNMVPYNGQLRIVYRARVVDGELRDEVGGSTDRAAWFALDAVEDLHRVQLVDLAREMAGV